MMPSMKLVSGAAAVLLGAVVTGMVDFSSTVPVVVAAASDDVNGTAGGGVQRTHPVIAKIQKERRHVLYHSRQLQGECMQVCEAEPVIEPQSDPEPPEPEECPEGKTMGTVCENDTQCIGWAASLPEIFSCPKCVKASPDDATGFCGAPPDVNGNLNCCKRTPGNDLVITNGCGANNVCLGFNDHDQCNVNQHALHCNPCCPGGNIAFDENDNVVKENGRVKVLPGVCTDTCDNDQGKPNEGLPAIYPLDYCLTENIKWKLRPNNNKLELNLTGTVSMTRTEVAASTVLQTTETKCLDDPVTPTTDLCVKADDCFDKHPEMMCPHCIEETGTCIDIADSTNPEEFADTVNGNLNCCKRTPGTSGIITNGCGANNICIGFNILDQCEVNDEAAYCNPYCPGGNVLFQTVSGGTRLLNSASGDEFKMENGIKVFATDEKNHVMFDENGCSSPINSHNLENNNGADNMGHAKDMVRIFPMEWCKCSDVKWRNRNKNDAEFLEGCDPLSVGFGFGTPTDPAPAPEADTGAGGCPAVNPEGSDEGLDQQCNDACLWENLDRQATRKAGLDKDTSVLLWDLQKTKKLKYIKNGYGANGARCCFGEDACKDIGKDAWKDNKPDFLAPLTPDAPVCCRGKNACYSTEIRYGPGGISCNSVTNGNTDGWDEQQTCSGAWFIEGNPANGGYPAKGDDPVGGRVPISCTGLQACYQVKWMNIEPTPVDICCNGIQTCYEFGYTSSYHGPPDQSSAECRDDVRNNGNTNKHSQICYQASFTDLGKNDSKRSMDVCVVDASGEGVSNDQEGYNLCGSDADCWCEKATANEMTWCKQGVPKNNFNLNKANLGAWHCTANGQK